MELQIAETIKMLTLLVVMCCLAAPTDAVSYPVFGTKRYHRSSVNSRSLVAPAPAMVYQTQSQQYYDEPSYLQPPDSYAVGGGGGDVAAAAAYAPESDNSYYYMPRRESQYYGLPTYRGEYKPKPYYYAHGPSYSYYDDRNEQANPLDDLHEEMQLEDERERQRELPVGGAGHENWYDNQQRPDKLTNAFLKNLILYNKELAVDKERPYEPVPASDFEDYEDPNAAAVVDYYEQQELTRQQELLQQQQQQQEELHQQQLLQQQLMQQQQQKYQKQQRHQQSKQQPQQRKSHSYSNDDVDHVIVEDKDVQELKSLANKNPQRKTKQQREQQKAIKQQQKQQKQRERQQQKQLKQQQEEQQRQLVEHERQQQQRQLLLQQQQQKQQQALSQPPMYTDYQQDNVAEYDVAEPEYDETSWINWDRKRSLLIDMEPQYQPQQPQQTLPQFSDHFFGFDDRKPVPIHSKSASAVAASPSSSIVTALPPVIGTTAPSSTQQQQQVLTIDAGTNGQKEVVLPRPATPVRHPFSVPVLEMLTHNAAAQNEHNAATTTNNAGAKTTVYDTIKQLMAMDQNLNKQGSQESSKMQKRFVTNEESLVRELDGLKRTA